MFSQLAPLFKTALRQAESTGTRLSIRQDGERRHAPDQNHDQTEQEPSVLWDDATTVSVESLRVFLQEFLAGRGIPFDTPAASSDFPAPDTLIPATPRAARAVRAYAATAATGAPSRPNASVPDTRADLKTLLEQDELAAMMALIEALGVLSARGVQTLTIERAETFMTALVNAVTLEQSRL